LVAAIPYGLSGSIDPAGEGGFRDDPTPPDRRDQVVLGHDPIPVLDEVQQDVEHLRFDGDLFSASAELPPFGIHGTFTKAKPQKGLPVWRVISRNNQVCLPNKSSISQSLPTGAAPCCRPVT
jgi:hypothetical protein